MLVRRIELILYIYMAVQKQLIRKIHLQISKNYGESGEIRKHLNSLVTEVLINTIPLQLGIIL